MKNKRYFSRHMMFLLVPLLVFGCSSGDKAASAAAVHAPVAKSINQAATQKKTLQRRPDSDDVVALLGDVEADFPGGRASVKDRILDGFQAGPARLRLDSGVTLYWGFEFRQGALQSVAIYDAKGSLRMVAAVDDILGLMRSGVPDIKSVSAYHAAVEKSGLHPGIFVYVLDEADLQKYMPYLNRWQQANLLGFNAECESKNMADVCALTKKIDVPVHAYIVSSDAGKTRKAEVPHVPASNTPIDLFRQ